MINEPADVLDRSDIAIQLPSNYVRDSPRGISQLQTPPVDNAEAGPRK